MGKPKRKKEEDVKTVLTAVFQGLVDIVNDQNVPAFLILKEGRPDVVRWIEGVNTSGEQMIQKPPDVQHLPFPLVDAEAALSHFECSQGDIMGDILSHLRGFAYLTDDQFLICAVYVLATYIQDNPGIQYLPMLLLNAVPERGKTRIGKAMTHICYRGVHCVDLREANLFRYSDGLMATLFLDIMDVWQKAERNQSEDILLLRYEKGTKVARVLHPEKGPFRDTRFYNVFGPTIMASNKDVHRILDTRCLTFHMPNKPGIYRNSTPLHGMPLRTRLTAWRAKHMNIFLPEVQPIEGITGRLWDVTRPLFQIIKMVSPDRYDQLVNATLNIATDRMQEKQGSDEGRLVQIIVDLSPDGLQVWSVSIKEITKKFNEGRPLEWEKTEKTIGSRLRALGITTKRQGGNYHAFLSAELIQTLGEQYGFQVCEKSPASPESHQYHDTIQEIRQDFQQDLINMKPKSCSNSCAQVNEMNNERNLQDFQDFLDGVEDIIIETTNGHAAEAEL